MFKNRTVIETMIILFTGVVVFVMVMTATTITIIEIQSGGDADTDRAVDGLVALITTILGALLGLIAGKATTNGDGTKTEPPP
jgi:high-affinity K+ transport system ATPase subunit B